MCYPVLAQLDHGIVPMVTHRCARVLSAPPCPQSIATACTVHNALRPRCLPTNFSSDPTCTDVGHRPQASVGGEAACVSECPCKCLQSICLPWPALAKAWSWLPTCERPTPPTLKELIYLFHSILRRHQGMLRRYNAPITLLPSDLLFVPSLQNLQGCNQPDHARVLLSLGSSHGCKATHEALHVPIPSLGLEGGHKPTPTN